MKAVDSAAGAVLGGAKGALDAFKSSAGGGADKGAGDAAKKAPSGGDDGAKKGSGGLGKMITSGGKALATGGASVAGDVAKAAGKKALNTAKDAVTGGKSPQSSTRKRGKGDGSGGGGADGAGSGGKDAGGGKGGSILAGMVKGAVEGSKSRLSGQVGAGSINAFGNMGGQKKPMKALLDGYKKFAMDATNPTLSEEGEKSKNKNAEVNP